MINNKEKFMTSPYPGEMLPYERYKLYNWVLDIKPQITFEVGTGNGGGSTYYIADALKQLNNSGKIYTCDPTRKIDKKLVDDYPFIHFHPIKSDEMLKMLVSKNLIPSFIMFDGPENPEIAYNDIKFLENYIEDGTYFSMHDWDLYRPYDNNKSTKAVKIREYFESSKNWILLERLDSNKKNSDFCNNTFDSVGLCLYQYKK